MTTQNIFVVCFGKLPILAYLTRAKAIAYIKKQPVPVGADGYSIKVIPLIAETGE